MICVALYAVTFKTYSAIINCIIIIKTTQCDMINVSAALFRCTEIDTYALQTMHYLSNHIQPKHWLIIS